MAISDVWNFGFLTPKKQFQFFKNKCTKNPKFYRYPKNGIYVIELCVTNSCTKFQANIFIFGCEMAQKPIDGNDVIFLKLDFWNFWLSYDKTNDIFGILRQNLTKYTPMF